ncbi:hypothetical protein RYA05_04490 [Pseudomonas syringae pv. actinidiae]|nr:hypothetical protein [Pseudomonas syringae pv. actinidiae]
MNLVFSYGAKQDVSLANAGFKFLGAGLDSVGSEVHVFQMMDADVVRDDAAEAQIRARAQLHVPHAVV